MIDTCYTALFGNVCVRLQECYVLMNMSPTLMYQLECTLLNWVSRLFYDAVCIGTSMRQY